MSNNRPLGDIKQFDVIRGHGDIIIYTKAYSDMWGDIIPIENHVSIDEARKIMNALFDAISAHIQEGAP